MAIECRLGSALALSILGLACFFYGQQTSHRHKQAIHHGVKAPGTPQPVAWPASTKRDLLAYKHLVTSDEMAKCLDGSPPSYYFRPGIGDGKDKWLLQYDGGGWCWTMEECWKRSFSKLGGSTNLPDSHYYGWAMMNASEGYFMRDWNIVYMSYCDGSFFTSDRAEPQEFNGRQLYFRGRYVHQAIVSDLLNNRGLSSAKEVVVTGCSAGGQTVFMNIDLLASMLPATATVSAVPDSGFMIPYAGADKCDYERKMSSAVLLHNSSWANSEACLDQLTDREGEAWKCFFFASLMVPHIRTPLFVLQSRYDQFQIGDLYCGGYSSDGVNAYGRRFADEFARAMAVSNPQNGYMLVSCVMHCGGWDFIEEDGHGWTQQRAFIEWYSWRLKQQASQRRSSDSRGLRSITSEDEMEARRARHRRRWGKAPAKNPRAKQHAASSEPTSTELFEGESADMARPRFAFTHDAEYECMECHCSADHSEEFHVIHY